MKNGKKRIISMLLLSLIFVLVGCGESASTKEVKVLEPIKDLSTLQGDVWLLDSEYAGDFNQDEELDFESVKWKKSNNINSFSVMNPETIFVGTYEKDDLFYGRFFKVTKEENSQFTFLHESFIASQKYLDKEVSEENQSSFETIANDSVPGSNDQSEYYQSVKFSKNTDTWNSTFYQLDDSTLIREVIYESGTKISLLKYTKK